MLEAAKARFESLGLEATSIRDVAKDAKVATGTVLLHFPDKKDLLHAAFYEELLDTWARAKALPPTKDLHADLCAIADAFFAYYAARPRLSRTLLKESLFADPPWQERFVGQIADVQARVVHLTEAAKRRGEFSLGLDAALLGAAFFSFYYFALLAWAQGGHPKPGQLFARLLGEHLKR